MTTPDELRAEAIRRIAAAFDLPAELAPTEPMTRRQTIEANAHTEAQEQFESLTQQLTRTHLRPALEAAGIPNPDAYHLTWEEPHADTP